MSSFTGPQLFDIRFQGERIIYELSLAEIAQSPLFVGRSVFSSLGSKALVPGADCPDTATLIPITVWNQHGEEPGEYASAFCMFEHNNGYPLSRHLSYAKPDGYYSGMQDSVLILRFDCAETASFLLNQYRRITQVDMLNSVLKLDS
ncbi:amine oxidase [Elysia marginata]|uniref:Amine oxidase n=1 Tax=Elysia marginata TaxID=1093978 RepID=A0AAV4HTB6_9GAST|nr:amine oxidase [Elysia marginata]